MIERVNLSYLLIGALFIKLLALGLSMTDCLGALVLLSAVQAEKVISFHFPKRTNVHKELSLIQSNLVEIKSKSEDLERDVTALKFVRSQR